MSYSLNSLCPNWSSNFQGLTVIEKYFFLSLYSQEKKSEKLTSTGIL